MRRLAALVSVLVLLAAAAVAIGANGCPNGFSQKFTARESELSVVILPRGYLFCAEASTGFVSGVIIADGRRSLDSYLPEDAFWRIFGPAPEPTLTPLPSTASSRSPGTRPSVSQAPTPSPSLPNAALPHE